MPQGLPLSNGHSVPASKLSTNNGFSKPSLDFSSISCLSISQVWCDVLNLLAGVICLINGFNLVNSPFFDHDFGRMGLWTGKGKL